MTLATLLHSIPRMADIAFSDYPLSAQDEFQRQIDYCYAGLKGVVAIVDEILVYGKTRTEHDANL